MNIEYPACERYAEHVFVNGKCFMCDKTPEQVAAENKIIREKLKHLLEKI